MNLPKSLTDVGEYAFANSPIESIELGNNLESIGKCAFANVNIQKVIIPGNIKTIEEAAFRNCKNLKEAIIEEGVEEIDNSAFEGCGALEAVSIPESVTGIFSKAFEGCNLLWEEDSLYLGKWLISCNASGEYSIREGTENIANLAFDENYLLTSVKIPKSLKSMGSNVFYKCLNLKSINVDDENTEYASIDGILYDKNKETMLFYPAGKGKITLDVPEGVKTISDDAFDFYMENGFKYVYFPDSLENIGMAFSYGKMEEVWMSDGIEAIGKNAFYHCDNLRKIVIGENVQTIGENAFYHCDNLRKIVIGRNVKTIGKDAFQNCLNLEEVVFCDDVEAIEDRAFHYCGNLNEIWLPKNLKTLGSQVFGFCRELKTVHISENLTNMGSYVFNDCGNLTEIYYDGNEEMWRQITKGDGNKELDKLVVYKYSDISVTVNGKEVEFDLYKYPYIKNERTMVPMRAIFEALGAEVTWDDESKTAIGVKDGVEVKITIGENVIYKNGEAIEIDAAAELKSESTMVPVRAISEAFGAHVDWDNDTRCVIITE